MKSSLATMFLAGVGLGGIDAATTGGNPIRKVVTMLQNVQKKVEAEAEKEEKLFSKYMCYCKTAGGDLQKTISASTTKIPQLQSDIEAAEAQKAQLDGDLEQHRADRTAAKQAIAEATALREKEAAAYAALKEETSSNIDAINKAVNALEKGMGGAFLQSQSASALRNLLQSKVDMSEDDRTQVMAFLGSSQASDYSPQSGQITGILKTQGDEMAASFADATSKENAAIAETADLLASKKKEVAASTAAIEAKTVRVGEVAKTVAQMKNDLSDSEEALIEDKKFLADLDKNCKTKQGEWDEIVKVRAEEQVALSETIKILNDDDALEMFKKTLPGAAASLLEIHSGNSARNHALTLLHGSNNPQIDFIALALRGKKVGFEKVIKMIDNMVALLKQEQADDNDKKEYCGLQFDSLDDKKKGLGHAESNAGKAID